MENCNQNEQGSGHSPTPNTPERAETLRDVERAREANRLHDEANREAERVKSPQGTRYREK
jgi:hypothetical protein